MRRLSVLNLYVFPDLFGVEFFFFPEYKNVNEQSGKVSDENDDAKDAPLDEASGRFEHSEKIKQQHFNGNEQDVKQSE